MPLFQWFHRNFYSQDKQRDDGRPIPCLTPAAKRDKVRSRLSISTSCAFARHGGGDKTLKSSISYPVLRSSSSPISSSDDSRDSTWGLRARPRRIEEKRRSSIYGLEEILRLSLCPPHLFPEDAVDSTFSSSSTRTSTTTTRSSESDDVSLSIFDEDCRLLLRPPQDSTATMTYYPHQPIVCSSTTSSPTRSRSRTLSPSQSQSFSTVNEIDGFSFSPTPASSAFATPFSTPARSIQEKEDEPTTPRLAGQAIAASPSSPLELPPPVPSLSHSVRLDVPPAQPPSLARNSGQWFRPTLPAVPDPRV
ncbi:hypothetical protein JCM11491_001072 [Sporobolomyces phaffii]